MRIEICTCEDNDDLFEHDGYYDSIEEAIARLKTLEQNDKISPQEALRIYKIVNCNRCVWQGYSCSGPILISEPECPPCLKFKRDPPDGGYYG